MHAKIGTINANGLAQLRAFLAANHKKGVFTDDQLRAWAADAEFQLAEGNPPSIEIKGWDSVWGRAQEYTITPAGVDWR